MPTRSKKSFLFDLPANELSKNLRTVVINEINQRKEQNLPIVYKNSLCRSRNQFVHEYPDGRKFLISQNSSTSEEKVIMEL